MISLVFPKLNSILFGQFFSEMQRSPDAELEQRADGYCNTPEPSSSSARSGGGASPA